MSFPPGTEMFQFPGFASSTYRFSAGYPHEAGGLPHSDTLGSKPARGSPRLFAACHVLHRLSTPRHPPDALPFTQPPLQRDKNTTLPRRRQSTGDGRLREEPPDRERSIGNPGLARTISRNQAFSEATKAYPCQKDRPTELARPPTGVMMPRHRNTAGRPHDTHEGRSSRMIMTPDPILRSERHRQDRTTPWQGHSDMGGHRPDPTGSDRCHTNQRFTMSKEQRRRHPTRRSKVTRHHPADARLNHGEPAWTGPPVPIPDLHLSPPLPGSGASAMPERAGP